MLIEVCANVSGEVAEYYKGYDINRVANALLEIFEFDNLPPMSGKREVEYRVIINNAFYEDMYKTYGPRSKKVSLGRLFEFGMNMDVLKSEQFKTFKDENYVPPDFGRVYLNNAYAALKKAQKYYKDGELASIVEVLRFYKFTKENTVYGLIGKNTIEGVNENGDDECGADERETDGHVQLFAPLGDEGEDDA